MIMNAKNFEETNNLSDNVKQTDLGANDPVLSSELVTDGTLMNASLLHEPSLGGTIVAGDSMSETFVIDLLANCFDLFLDRHLQWIEEPEVTGFIGSLDQP